MIDVWVERASDGPAPAHEWLRERVAPCLGVNPDDVPLHVDRDGGLSLLATDFHVSLSHHRQWRSVALSGDGPVGIDVLAVPEDADFVDDTTLVLSSDEIAWVHSAPREQQGAAFAECWVRKEAYAKLRRTGLTGELSQLTFSPKPISTPDVAFWMARVDDAMVAVATFGARVPEVRLHTTEHPAERRSGIATL